MKDYELGRYVRYRERYDGSHYTFFSVPEAHRPKGWPAHINIPEEGKRSGSLKDPMFRARVCESAALLNARLDERRHLDRIYSRRDRQNMRAAVDIYYRTKRYRDLSESSKYRNARHTGIIIDWAEGRGDPDFSTFRKVDFEDLLAIFDDRPSEQMHIRSVLNIICKEAINAGWRSDNPAEDLPWTQPAPKEDPVLWKGDLPLRYADMARQMHQPGLAALIEIGAVVGQRLGDLRTLKHDTHLRHGRIRLTQLKTGAKVSIQLTRNQVELIESVRVSGSRFVFNDFDTGTGFSAHGLWRRFDEVRLALTQDGEPRLVMRSLRHTAVCNMIDSKVPEQMIAAVTGHRAPHLRKIIERYAVDKEQFADQAMRMVNRNAGGQDDDFDAAVDQDRDWQDAVPAYQRPTAPEGHVGKYLGAALGQHRLKYTAPAEWPDEDPELGSAT